MRVFYQEVRRREAGMTQAELGRNSGVQANIISWIESGRFKPYPTQLERIAEALGVEAPEDLLREIEVN